MKTITRQEQSRTGLRVWQHGAVFLLACAVIISRRPDAVFHAQFWAEDGHVWYADAYNRGWLTALFRVHTGYFQTLPRLGAALALLAPISFAPLVLNVIAIALRALPVNILLSHGSARWGSLRFRVSLATIYLIVPNCREMSFGITESQWLLALSVFLLLVASTPRSSVSKAFEVFVLLLSGLTGPFCIVLFPFALVLAWRESGRWQWVRAGMLSVLSLIQAWGLFVVDPRGRAGVALGATPMMFIRILGGQIYVGTLLGSNALASKPGFGPLIFLACVAIGGTVLVSVCFLKLPLPLKLFLLFAATIFALSLISPTGSVSGGMSAWENLASGAGIRYWLFPTLGFAWLLAWCVQGRNLGLKATSIVLLSFMCFGVIRDWRSSRFLDMHFAAEARRFELAPAGTTVTIPENPEGWSFSLVKR